MLIRSAQTLSFGSTESEQIAILKSNSLYSGIRITFEEYKTADGVAGTTNIMDLVNGLIVDVPEYGARSRRIDLDANTMPMLPVIAKLGAVNAPDAAAATSIVASTGVDGAAGVAYVDVPINKQNLNEDTRITITAKSSAATHALKVTFAFLNTPFRNVYFRCYNIPSTTSHQQWFPSDGVLRGIVWATQGSGFPDSGANLWATREVSEQKGYSQATLNGEQLTTYTDVNMLSAGLDEVISGGNAEFIADDWYAMLQNFPVSTAAQYVDISRTAAAAFTILGVMSDA